MLNTQSDFGITQMTPANPLIPHEDQQFLQDERPWGVDQNFRQVYVQNFERIRDSETINRRSRTYLCYLNHSASSLIDTISQALDNVYRLQSNA